ncbi:MAG TPA: N-acetylglucosamine-6-phosphate deacetylase [Streptosporangiaceae bacterium]|nr:N-acetylglucosamine-6-phosphate deacetylase [Streptosporangiaceae bacterium]
MADTLIVAGRVVPATSTDILSPGFVRLSGGVVTEVGGGRPSGPADFDLADGVLVPGFVDLQVNGHFGVDLAAVDPAGWATVVRRLPETGTTAFLPTFITGPVHKLAAALRATADLLPGLPLGARVLGVHLEGPFISLRRRGAHDPEWIIDADPEMLGELVAAGGGALRLVTLAPERHGGLAAIKLLTDAGVRVSVGHSDATAAQVAAAADAGARMVTHLFNAQAGMHHREPGVVGQALGDPRFTSGLIADLHHVAPIVCRIAFAAAPGRIALVTDAASCAGMPPGRFQLGGQPIELPPGDGVPPVRADGTLAGSALRMDVGVSNMVAVGVGLAAAVTAATRVPADVIGRPDLGRISPGAPGDLVWLSGDLRTRATWIAGDLAYSAEPHGNRQSHHSFEHVPLSGQGSVAGQDSAAAQGLVAGQGSAAGQDPAAGWAR